MLSDHSERSECEALDGNKHRTFYACQTHGGLISFKALRNFSESKDLSIQKTASPQTLSSEF